jgi:hypothetical protein
VTTTHRSRYALLSLSLGALVAVMLLAAVAVYNVGELPGWGWAGFGMVWLALVARANRVRVAFDDRSLLVVNFFRTVKVPREDVLGVTSSEFLLMAEPLLAIVTRSGACRVTASMAASPRGRARTLEVFGGWGLTALDPDVGLYREAGVVESLTEAPVTVVVIGFLLGAVVGWAVSAWLGALLGGVLVAVAAWAGLRLVGKGKSR